MKDPVKLQKASPHNLYSMLFTLLKIWSKISKAEMTVKYSVPVVFLWDIEVANCSF